MHRWPADRYTDPLARFAKTFDGTHLDAIRPDPITLKKRGNRKREDDIRLFRSTRWHCGYCASRIILPGIFYVIGHLEPKRFRYTPGHGYPLGDHPAIMCHYATVDHYAAGGGDDPSNHVACCDRCQAAKSDFRADDVGLTRRRRFPRDGWKGLGDRYLPLWERAGCFDRKYHVPRLKALGHTIPRLKALGYL